MNRFHTLKKRLLRLGGGRGLPALALLCAASLSASSFLAGCKREERQAGPETLELNFGHFPNISHAQGLVAHHLSRTGKGWFEERLEKRLGRPVRINWYAYNAGPSAMEALFANSIQLTYVGPSPAINAFVRSGGKEVRLLAGAAEGGAALVIPGNSKAQGPEDFRGKVLATPQMGNTQDVSCRAWLRQGGLSVSLTGGDATILPTANPEQLRLFSQGRFDGVWTVEPWVTRLEQQAGGRVLVDESDSLTTVLASSASFLKENPDIARALVDAHRELTEWIQSHPEEAQRLVTEELEALTHSRIEPALVTHAWKRIHLTARLRTHLLRRFVEDAHHAGFMKETPDVSGLVSPLADTEEAPAEEKQDANP